MTAAPARAQEQTTATRLAFPGKQQVVLESYQPRAVTGDLVRQRALCSLMSTGTENIVFNRLFEAGSHWDNWVRYPFFPGYATVGVIEEVGPAVTTLKAGDIVASRHSHASQHVIAAHECFPVPAGLDPRLASWFALAKICFQGARAAAYQLGDDVLIIGAGPIGQMSTRWARALGAQRIVVVDQVAQRLALARAGGATGTVAKPIGEAADEIRAAFGGGAPRVVIDGTGNEQVFAHALRLVARLGTVVVLGDTGSPSQQRLTPDVITRGLHIVGAHDGLDDARWNTATIARYFFDLAAQGRFALDGLNTHVFKPADCAKAYETANTKRGETMGIVFDWT